MASYMEQFQGSSPLAKDTKKDDPPLAQMARPTPQVNPNLEPSLFDQASSAVTEKGINYGLEKTFEDGGFFEKGLSKMKGMFTPTPATLTPLPGGPTIANASPVMQQLGPTVAKANMLAGTPTVATTAGALPGSLASTVGTGTAATGATGLTSALGTGAATAGGGAAAGGAMAGMAAAAPWLLGGLAIGKAFGLFNRGGPVGHHIGGMINMPGPLSGIRYKYDGGKVKEEVSFDFKGPLSR